MKLSLTEEITYSTIRIEAIDVSGSILGTGSGFILDISDEKNTSKPLLITNKHVANISTIFRLVFCVADGNDVIDDKHHSIVFSTDYLPWVHHPEADIDLVALPIAEFYLQSLNDGVKLFYRSIGYDLIPSDVQREEIDALEEIAMIGYPIGLWDSVNNKPLIRRGVTSTHYNLDYCGRKEFLIDCACFPGSSGSPVFILNAGSFKKKSGGLAAGNRVMLLGVLYAGPQFNAQGDLKVVDIPTAQTAIISSAIPMNLGIVIKSEKLLDFKKLI